MTRRQHRPQCPPHDFGLANGAAGLVALIALPLAGALCDHTRSRWGRRRVWMAGGVVVFAAALALTGLQGSWTGVLACWLVGTNVPQSLAPLGAALIIDQLGGYPTLFGVAGAVTIAGAVMVYRIRSVR